MNSSQLIVNCFFIFIYNVNILIIYMNKNEETLKKMYDIFVNYDINESESIDDKFLEMMSDYKNFNTLMNIAFGLDTSKFINENITIDDKRIVYNIKKFGPLYRNIYESYKKCFSDMSDDNIVEDSNAQSYNILMECCNEQLQHINKDELINTLKNIITNIENDNS